LVGRPSEKLEGLLSKFNVIKLQGRDEFDTNNLVNEYILKGAILEQGILTTGDIFELLLMNSGSGYSDDPLMMAQD
jgi:uncharacterized pyridoxamine 5'-phosphate oxidase family protein